MCPLIYLKRKKTSKSIDISCNVLGARRSAVSVHPRAVLAREHPRRPAAEQPLHQHLRGVGSVWTTHSYPNCREEAGGSLSETLWRLCSTWKTYPGWFCFLKTTLCGYFGAQEKSKHGRDKCQVCGALFSRRDAAMKFSCTLTRGGGAQVTDGRAPWPIASRFTKIGSFTRPAGVDQVCSNNKNSNSRNAGKCPSKELQRDLASVDRCGQCSELGRRPQCNPGPLGTTPEGAPFFPLKRGPHKAEPLWPPAFSSVCGSGRFITFSCLRFLCLLLSGPPPVPESKQKGI